MLVGACGVPISNISYRFASGPVFLYLELTLYIIDGTEVYDPQNDNNE